MATVRHIDPDRREAMRWLQGQLEWESRLQQLRNPWSVGSDRVDERSAA